MAVFNKFGIKTSINSLAESIRRVVIIVQKTPSEIYHYIGHVGKMVTVFSSVL